MPVRTLLALSAAFATTTAIGADLSLTWHTIDGGGGVSSGGGFTLEGTIGQPDAGGTSGASALELVGGFWGGAGEGAPPCPADVDGDGMVAVSDLLAVLADWGACVGCPADTNDDGVVDVADLLAVLAEWGLCD